MTTSYDPVLDKILSDPELCDVVEENLIDMLKAFPDAQGRIFTGPWTTLTRSDLASLNIDGPEVLVFEVPGDENMNLSLDLRKLDVSDVEDIKGLIFHTDRSITLTGLKNFEGAIQLGDGNDKVSAGGSENDITVCAEGGNDSVKTGSGNDTISTGGGNDTVSSGGGKDKILVDGPATGGSVSAGSGDDEIIFTKGFSGGLGVRISIKGGADQDTLDLSGLGMDILAVRRAAEGIRITLEDQTVLKVKNVEFFSYTDNGQVKVVGVQAFDEAFPDAPVV